MNPEYRVVNIRVFRGLNLLEDARITDPGSFTRLQNIYRKSPGILASRPGSRVFAPGAALQIEAPADTELGTSQLIDTRFQGLTDVVLTSAIADIIHLASKNTYGGPPSKGLRGMFPKIMPHPVPSRSALDVSLPTSGVNLSIAPAYVEALHRLYTDGGARRFLIGAYAFEGGLGDRLFYVDDESTTPVCRLMTYPEALVGSGSTWQFVNYHVPDPTFTGLDIFAIGTSGVGMPFFIGVYNDAPVPGQLIVVKSSDSPTSGAPAASIKRLFAVRSMCVYNGSMVYGGYQYGTASGGSREDKSNYICFSEPNEPWKIAATDGEVSDIRIGDNITEPVTHVTVNSVATDAQGIKGQLVVFTSRRVVTYDGLPPVSGNPTGVAFHSVALADVGCVAYKTVQQTPAGLMFLGTDGLVYIIPKFSNGGPLPVSRTIESVFNRLTLNQQRNCAAVYDDGQYKISVPEVNQSSEENGEAYRVIDTTASPYAGGGGTLVETSAMISRYGNAAANIPNVQYWLDIREPPDGSVIDFGYTWTGPHTGMKHNCFARGTQFNDFNVLWAGSAIDGTIFQASVEGLASDPLPTNVATTTPMVYDIRTGQFDAGDIHVDKSVKSMQYGLYTTAALNVISTIECSGEVANSTIGESFTDSFAPIGLLMNGTTLMGDSTAVFAPGASFRFEDNHPSSPKRGRTFGFRWYSAPSTASIIKFSDMAFVFEVHKRRGN